MKTIVMTLMLVLMSVTGASAQGEFFAQFADKPDYTVVTLDSEQIKEQGDSVKAGEMVLKGYANQVDSVFTVYSASPKANARLLEAAHKEFSEDNGFGLLVSGNNDENGESFKATILTKGIGEDRFITVFIVEKLSSDPMEVCVGALVGTLDLTTPFGIN